MLSLLFASFVCKGSRQPNPERDAPEFVRESRKSKVPTPLRDILLPAARRWLAGPFAQRPNRCRLRPETGDSHAWQTNASSSSHIGVSNNLGSHRPDTFPVHRRRVGGRNSAAPDRTRGWVRAIFSKSSTILLKEIGRKDRPPHIRRMIFFHLSSSSFWHCFASARFLWRDAGMLGQVGDL
jgi:hypothetical protein